MIPVLSRPLLSRPTLLGTTMALALFDLDHTLLDGDSDYLWGEHLAAVGAVDAAQFRAANARYYRDYLAGLLDIQEFLRFVLAPLAAHPLAQLLTWRTDFVRDAILPRITADARELLASHRRRGDTVLIVTATNRFVTEPIAAELGVGHLLATELESQDGNYTGRVLGTPCFRDGKLTHVARWIETNGGSLDTATFYSDSHNDLPLLERVAHPVVVNADRKLAGIAATRGWPSLTLRSAASAAESAAPHLVAEG